MKRITLLVIASMSCFGCADRQPQQPRDVFDVIRHFAAEGDLADYRKVGSYLRMTFRPDYSYGHNPDGSKIVTAVDFDPEKRDSILSRMHVGYYNIIYKPLTGIPSWMPALKPSQLPNAVLDLRIENVPTCLDLKSFTEQFGRYERSTFALDSFWLIYTWRLSSQPRDMFLTVTLGTKPTTCAWDIALAQ